MSALAISRNRPIHLLLIFSMMASFLVLPAPSAKAGMLGSLLSTLRPYLGIAGKIGGAVIGASMCSAFCPPLGMIAGGIAGWIAGGIITGTATASLGNLAAVGCGVVGAMALGPGAIGMIGGFLLGAFLGKTAVGLLQKADRSITGGILLSPAGVSNSNAFSNSGSVSISANSGSTAAAAGSSLTPVNANQTTSVTEQLKAAQERYQKAYTDYTTATQVGDTQGAAELHKTYLSAYQEYQNLLRSK
ncbi:MAG TPA: hypothetical protein PKO06_14265 [Candidatus Ozemobacteraceae bacterium]|nr:hypothetical protein [Candidatus Ozemobacteraceae bacterium]